MSANAVSSDELLDEACPFHVVVDRDMRIQRVGATLARLIPGGGRRDRFENRFRIAKPHIGPTFEEIHRRPETLFVLESTDLPLRLRGQILPRDELCVFLCAPSFTAWEDVAKLGLKLEELPLSLVDQLENLDAVRADADQRAAKSERKLATTTSALRASEERYRVLFESSPIGKCVFDRDSLRFLAVNDAVLRMYGYSREEFLQLRVTDVKRPEDIPELRRQLSTLKAGGLDIIPASCATFERTGRSSRPMSSRNLPSSTAGAPCSP